MAQILGLDFGTTNSVAAFIQRDPESNRFHARVLSDNQGRPHPSVVWYNGAEVVVGRKAKDQMSQVGLGVFGDVVRSPKMFLGSHTGIHVGGVNRPATDVVADVLKFVRSEGLRAEGEEFEFSRAVMTVPVAMDGAARRELRQAALAAGIHVHQFVHEPLAALYGYLRAQDNFHELCTSLEGKLMLVFDWGGGTLDLTLCRVVRGMLVQIMNLGENEVGGDKFDEALVRLAKRKHAESFPEADWSKLQTSAEARLVSQCEAAKIILSTKSEALLFVRDMLAQDGEARHLDLRVSKAELIEATSDLVSRGLGAIELLLSKAGVPRTAIDLCLVTGGMAAMPAIHQGLIQYFDAARVRTVKNSATIIAEGAAWIGHDEVRVTLAKPIEVLNADDVYFPIMRAGQELPTEGNQISEKVSLYCVDPRDRKAKFVLARNRWPGREGAAEVRVPYDNLTVAVDHHTDPLMERLELTVTIDHNCVASARATSALRKDSRTVEITNLEFGLRLPTAVQTSGDDKRDGAWHPTAIKSPPGSVRPRSNVTDGPYNLHLVPGEIAKECRVRRQHEEKMYYVPCGECGRTIYEIERYGCEPCSKKGRAPSPAEAEARFRASQDENAERREVG